MSDRPAVGERRDPGQGVAFEANSAIRGYRSTVPSGYACELEVEGHVADRRSGTKRSDRPRGLRRAAWRCCTLWQSSTVAMSLWRLIAVQFIAIGLTYCNSRIGAELRHVGEIEQDRDRPEAAHDATDAERVGDRLREAVLGA